MTEEGRELEDIQHALRGSRGAPAYRLNKNVARHIRYRLTGDSDGDSDSDHPCHPIVSY